MRHFRLMISWKREREKKAVISPESQYKLMYNIQTNTMLIWLWIDWVASFIARMPMSLSRQLFTKWRQCAWSVTTTLVCSIPIHFLLSFQTAINLYITTWFHAMKPRNLHDCYHNFSQKCIASTKTASYYAMIGKSTSTSINSVEEWPARKNIYINYHEISV